MHRSHRPPRWLLAGAFSVGLALVFSFAVPTFFSAHSSGIAAAQSDNDDDDDDDVTPTQPSAPAPQPAASPAPAASPSPVPSTGSGTGTGTGTGTTTSAPASTGTQQSSGSSSSTTLTSADDALRGGSEMPGQPNCYKPPANVTERKMYSESRPACYAEGQ